MRKLKILRGLTVALMAIWVTGTTGQSFSPEAGDKSVSLRLGRGASFGDLQYQEVNQRATSPDYYNWNGILPAFQNQPGQPYSFNLTSSNNMNNIIGAEIKYFISSQMAVRFNGGGSVMSSPSSDALEVTGDDIGSGNETAEPGTFVPGWEMLEGRTTMQYYGDLGVDYYFTGKYERVNPYAGVQGNATYGQMEIFDGYGGVDEDGEVVSSLDTRNGEGYAFGGSFVGGIDYYLSEGFILGIELKICNYMYNVKRVFHEPGMEPQEASTHQTSFLSQPVIKLGFRF